ncbi:hypothetical protein [Sphingomonas sp. VNH70]|uniref:hypothetical protein n=1 Tax=Sphingomonas silueang TaxID=3156617 RepID=UPI0032B484F7
MFAKQRLFLTSDKARLVLEDDPAAATLYAIPGDEVPDSAAALFGLVDGELREAILRIVVIGSDPVAVAGLRFADTPVLIHDGQIDEAELLAILSDDRLGVEARTFTDDWIAFPGREKAAAALRAHVDYDKANGRAHDRVEIRHRDDGALVGPEVPEVPVDDTMVPVPPPVAPAPPAPIAPTDTVAAPVAAVVGADAVAAAIEGDAPLPEPSPIAAPIAADAPAAAVTADDPAVAAIRGDAPLPDAAPAPAPAPVETPKERRPGEDKERRTRETKGARTARPDAE